MSAPASLSYVRHRQCAPVNDSSTWGYSGGTLRQTLLGVSDSRSIEPEIHAEPAKGLGLPLWRVMVDDRQAVDLIVPLEDEVAEDAPCKVACRNTVSNVLTCPCDTIGTIESHGRMPVARNPKRPAPSMGNPDSAEAGKEFDHRCLDLFVHGIHGVVLR